MHNLITIIKALIVTLCALLTAPSMADQLDGKVVGISDGDTLKLLTPQRKQVKVRLSQIDAPESKQAFGTRSRQELARICFGKSASLDVEGEDRYGRKLARVRCAGVDAQSHMVQAGMAWVYDRYVTDKSLYQLQQQAQNARKGVWSDPKVVAPWEFRQASR
jgi:endonuclease YncB( thermonuclease family)